MESDSKSTQSVIVGIALILSAIIFGSFYYSAQTSSSKDLLSVTGSAKTSVTSDQAKLTVAVSRTIYTSALSSGYAAISRDIAITKSLLKREGVDEKEITESPVSTNQVYDNNPGAEVRYELRQTVTIESTNVNKITELSKKIPSLADQGAIVSIQSLEYYYSKLPDLRVSLLGDAVKDAKARAEKIAESTDRKVGNIRSASSGVVQVLPLNSIDVSDYGTYDTGSIEKDVMVTVKAAFSLK